MNALIFHPWYIGVSYLIFCAINGVVLTLVTSVHLGWLLGILISLAAFVVGTGITIGLSRHMAYDYRHLKENQQ